LYFSDVAIAQNEVGLLAGKCGMAALLTEIQMSPTLNTCRVLLNTSPIVLVDSGGHLFARLAEPTMAEPGESFVLLYKKKNVSVFAKVKTAPRNSPAPIVNPRLDVSATNGGSPWDGRSSKRSFARQQAVRKDEQRNNERQACAFCGCRQGDEWPAPL
jgi:hypothetical protein